MNPAAIFPCKHHLQVTTHKHVILWSRQGQRPIFRSESGGIIGAKRLDRGSHAMLAVADSQVVVLHDIDKGIQQSYRLKSREDQVRTFHFDKSSQVLFYTTSLQAAVQSYSVRESRILGSGPTHSSPPTAFALSKSGKLLVSASSEPQTIFVTNLEANALPFLLIPKSSSSSVLALTFHETSEGLFAAAFGDGSIAVYDGTGQLTRHIPYGSVREVGCSARIHVPCTKHSEDEVSPAGFGPDTGFNWVGDQADGITSLAFVPNAKCKTVSVAADGRCCVLDFAHCQNGAPASLIQQWHIPGAASALAVLYSPSETASNSRTRWSSCNESDKMLVAIGQSKRMVFIYNLLGNLLLKKRFPGTITNLEWVNGPGISISERSSSKPSSRRSSKGVTHVFRPHRRKPSISKTVASINRNAKKAKAAITENEDKGRLQQTGSPITYISNEKEILFEPAISPQDARSSCEGQGSEVEPSEDNTSRDTAIYWNVDDVILSCLPELPDRPTSPVNGWPNEISITPGGKKESCKTSTHEWVSATSHPKGSLATSKGQKNVRASNCGSTLPKSRARSGDVIDNHDKLGKSDLAIVLEKVESLFEQQRLWLQKVIANQQENTIARLLDKNKQLRKELAKSYRKTV